MAYYYGDLNIAMLNNCKREPLDLPLEVTILHILSLYSNYIINLMLKIYTILKFYYSLCCNRLPQYFNVYHKFII